MMLVPVIRSHPDYGRFCPVPWVTLIVKFHCTFMHREKKIGTAFVFKTRVAHVPVQSV